MLEKGWLVKGLVTAGIIVATVLPGRAQDVVKVSPEHNKVVYENDHVRVIEKKLAPGEKDAMHRSSPGWYYVKKSGSLRVKFEDGEVEIWEGAEGQSGWLEADAPHTYENLGKTTLEMVIVEIKSASKSAAATAASAQQ